MPTATLPLAAASGNSLADHYQYVRSLSEAITSPLSDADATVQSMDDASPAKWHLAHTTWFFETFVLRNHVPRYRPFDARFAYLFNSYYEAEGERHARPKRGMLSRPSLDQVRAWRRKVDDELIAALPSLDCEALALVELGLAHEQQHQELMLTDMLNLFAENPLMPAIWEPGDASPDATPPAIQWIEGRHGIVEIGHDPADGFAFDCEGPRHPVLLHRHAIASRPITNGEWLAFMADGSYQRPELWLSDGWAWVKSQHVEAPLYWQQKDQAWHVFGLSGSRAVNLAAPVTHISHYEADAYARWAGARLPTEAEWETAAQTLDANSGNQLDQAGPVCPSPAIGHAALQQMFGDVWEWTASAYLPHPGFRPAEGAVGEYNGKFMSGQQVLKGGSCATPRGHMRASYRNFFYPHQRWQFTGLRLAKDL